MKMWSSGLFWMSSWWESEFQCFLVFNRDLVQQILRWHNVKRAAETWIFESFYCHALVVYY